MSWLMSAAFALAIAVCVFVGDTRAEWKRWRRSGGIAITTGKRCRCRAFVLNRRGEPRCGNHARS